jgi:type II secretory pathway pseudopilin PulG
MALIAVMAGLVVPSMTGFGDSARLQGAARALLSQCRYARDLAVRRNSYARVMLDTEAETHHVAVLLQPDARAIPPAAGDSPPVEESAVPLTAAGDQAEWSDETGNLGSERQLPEGIAFDRLITRDPSGEPVVTFGPDGQGEELFVVLKDGKGRRLAVHVQGTTGMTAVLSPDDDSEAFETLDQQAENVM